MRKSVAGVFAFVVMATVIAPVRGAIYMRYDGIDGEVTSPGYENTIDLASFSLSVGRAVNSSGHGVSTPVFSDVSITSLSSAASVDLFKEALIGEGRRVNLYLTTSAGGKLSTYAEWDFEGGLITSFHTSSGGDRAIDSYTLNYTKVTYTWNNIDDGGNLNGTESFTYDLTTGMNSVTASGDTEGFAFVTDAPEPGSLGMMGLGVGMLLRRRRR